MYVIRQRSLSWNGRENDYKNDNDDLSFGFHTDVLSLFRRPHCSLNDIKQLHSKIFDLEETGKREREGENEREI